MLYDLLARRMVRADLIPAAQVHDLRQVVDATIDEVAWAWESTTGHQWTDSFLDAGFHNPSNVDRVPDNAPPADHSIKVYLGHRDVGHYELLDMITPIVPHGLAVSTSGAPFLEVTAPGVTKAKGLADLCADLGVDPRRTAAFGDNVNDVEMLQWVGRGYAMANSHPRLKAVADNHTDHPNDADGVALALERLFGFA